MNTQQQSQQDQQKLASQQIQPPQEPPRNNKNKFLTILGIILAILVSFALGIYIEHNFLSSQPPDNGLTVNDGGNKDPLFPANPKPGMSYKPVVYLYPSKTEKIHISLNFKGGLTKTSPVYNAIKGWNVTARPNGDMINEENGKTYKSLYWEGGLYNYNIDEKIGFVVKGDDTKKFLQKNLDRMGLNKNERNEFIQYWLPKMSNNPYNFIQFVGDKYTSAAQLNITPKPDSLLRVFMAYKPLNNPIKAQAQEIKPFNRTGFTAIEWGGTRLAE